MIPDNVCLWLFNNSLLSCFRWIVLEFRRDCLLDEGLVDANNGLLFCNEFEVCNWWMGKLCLDLSSWMRLIDLWCYKCLLTLKPICLLLDSLFFTPKGIYFIGLFYVSQVQSYTKSVTMLLFFLADWSNDLK